jgi:hypothetical protein
LSPLEIGIHALAVVGKAKGGKGKKGGLSRYAELLGKSHQYLSQLVQAAEVAEAVKPATQVAGLIERAKHLCAIHALPRRMWAEMVAARLDRGSLPSRE